MEFDRKKQILIVEDSHDMQEIYKIFFKAHADKYQIAVEGDAEKALEKVKAEPFDLIVLDIIMEPMTGEAFLVYLRENESTAETPVVVVSMLNQDMLKGLRQYQRMEFLQKPITELQLLAAIEGQLA